jgi:3-deoxy-manno-octulosonate cytidylyltransferase (CMP-KDO synthetase)
VKNNLEIIALIPARMGSTRFPGKPMAKIFDKPMIGHVFDRVSKCELLAMTAVATCDLEIFQYIQSIGGKAIMTGNHHERASDRCAEALSILEKEEKRRFDIVVMVQGDEPMVDPRMIEEALQPMLVDPSVLVTNLLGKIRSEEEFADPNCIKIVCDLEGYALYFSRSSIPNSRGLENILMGKQICVIPFRSDFLKEYTSMDPTPLEEAESIDMLRVLENGKKVRLVRTSFDTQAVDTPEDLENVVNIMKKIS